MNPAQDAKGIQHDAEPATIPEAYSELSQEAFAIWMRLLCCSDTQLEQGRKAISIVLGYSEGRSNVILRELKHKGYITFKPADRPGLPTTINIRRKAIISGPARIIRLGRSGSSDSSGLSRVGSAPTQSFNSVLQDFEMHPENAEISKTLVDCQIRPANIGLATRNLSNQKPTSLFSQNLENAPKPGANTSHERPGKKKKPKQKFVGLGGGYVSNGKADSKTTSQAKDSTAIYKPTLSVDTLKKKKIQEDIRRKDIRQKAKDRRQKAEGIRDTADGKRKKRKKQKQDLTKMDLRGKPQVKFDCNAAERKQYMELLDRNPQSPLRRQFLEKIETECTRLYTRYRREYDNLYEVYPKERTYMREFGALCIRKGVTPSQVLAYWREHIGEFANKTMDIVPPSFLKSASNIDTAAIAVMASTRGGKRKWKPGSFKEEHTPVHSYSDTSMLHPRLRRGLESAGFDVSGYSDRYLMSVQSPAKDLAAGRTPFISSKIRPMAEWAAEHLFSKEGKHED